MAEPLFQRLPPESQVEESSVLPRDIASLRRALRGDALTVGEPEAERGHSSASSTISQRRPRDTHGSESASLRRRVDGSENPSSELRWQSTGTGWVPGDIDAREHSEHQAVGDGGVLSSVPASPTRAGGTDVSSPASPMYTPTSPEAIPELEGLIADSKDQTETFL